MTELLIFQIPFINLFEILDFFKVTANAEVKSSCLLKNTI